MKFTRIIKINIKSNKGFTLIETLVALSIFVFSLLPMIYISSNSISNINYTKNKLIASYLASEGLEYIRNVRDTQVLHHGWDDFLYEVDNCLVRASHSLNNECYFDVKLGFINLCPNNNCPFFNFDDGNGYNYTTGPATSFRRVVQVELLEDGGKTGARRDGSKEVKVTSSVYWNYFGKEYKISLVNYLKNWQESQ